MLTSEVACVRVLPWQTDLKDRIGRTFADVADGHGALRKTLDSFITHSRVICIVTSDVLQSSNIFLGYPRVVVLVLAFAARHAERRHCETDFVRI